MRITRTAGLTVGLAGLVLGVQLPAFADTAAGSTLYVNNTAGSHCSDSGANAGTQAQPFCTISAAAGVVNPGQTVQIGPSGDYPEQVHLTRSGTPDQPITFLGVANSNPSLSTSPRIAGATALTLSGVHDVVVRKLNPDGDTASVVITDSSRVTVDSSEFSGAATAVRVSGQSDHVTISRNSFYYTHAVVVDPGVTNTVITTNNFDRDYSTVSATDAPGTVVTNNTVALSCGANIELDGASTGSTVENNIVTVYNKDLLSTTTGLPPCGAGGGSQPGVSVAAGSTVGTKVDYNVVHPRPASSGDPGSSAYSWAGTAYPSPQAFDAATGQGAHDVDQDIAFNTAHTWRLGALTEADTSAIDSADPNAPGALPTDLHGAPPMVDPLVTQNPAGNARDRGAYELQGLQSVDATVAGTLTPSPQGPAPLTVKVAATVVNTWPTPVTYTYDFGDGSTPLVTADATVTHTYTALGGHLLHTSAAYANGVTVTNSYQETAVVSLPGPLSPVLALSQMGAGSDGLVYTVDSFGSTSPYRITTRTVDFGDGTAPFDLNSPTNPPHDFGKPGTYTVKLTEADESGRTATVSKVVNADYTDQAKDMLSGERVRVLVGSGGSPFAWAATANYTRGGWDPFTQGPYGRFNDSTVSAAYTANGDLHKVDVSPVTGAGTVYISDWHSSNLSWSQAIQLPTGSLYVVQAAVAAIGDDLHVVALTRDGRVYEAVGHYDGGWWSSWGDVTAAAGLNTGTTQISASAMANTLHIAAFDSSRHLRIADGDYTKGTWGSGDLGAAIGLPSNSFSQLATAVTGSKFHVLALDSGGNVYQATGDYAAGTWSIWSSLAPVIGLPGAVSQLAATATGNTLHLFALSGGRLYNANGDYTHGTWSPWADTAATGMGAVPAGASEALAVAGTN